MSAQNARDAADDIVARLRLPGQVEKGHKLQLVTFLNEEDCRFFYPRRAMKFHLQINTYISRALRERGIRVQRVAITPEDYYAWLKRQPGIILGADGAPPSPEQSKREFADSHLYLLD